MRRPWKLGGVPYGETWNKCLEMSEGDGKRRDDGECLCYLIYSHKTFIIHFSFLSHSTVVADYFKLCFLTKLNLNKY